MKQTFFFLFLFLTSQLLTAQDTNISVISVEKSNIVYRGISNPIKIAVPGAKSYKATSSGKLTKKDSLGNYLLNVNGIQGRIVKINIEATLENDSIINEYKEFEVKEISTPRANILSSYYRGACEMTLSQLKELNLNIVIDNLAFTPDSTFFRIRSFEVYVKGKERIWINGSKMTEKAFESIKDIPVGTEVLVNIHQHTPYGYRLRPIPPLKIEIIEPENFNIPLPEVYTQYGSDIVYRGIENTLNIRVPEAKSFKVKGKGLKMLHDSTYVINVSKIKKDKIFLDFEIINKNDSVIRTQEVLYIKERDTRPKKITVNGKGCSDCILKMKLEELKDAIIDIRVDDAENTLAPQIVEQFEISLSENETLSINGNTISESAFELLSVLPEESVITIKASFYLTFSFSHDPTPLKVMITNE
ncbi:hypothetical protein FUA48_13325 [Flavobacterium alkalisoli]|uniref:Gliding motility-associated protein GldM second immunoglobulin-like domain-containing protein n=1 Tax=Flavobacterium alkalisoli TaxID=2602769 RepID=A0A5B9FW75_9FLAO|nr:GldM family protein [Flavobacterium alkalisoli]QEE50519.1 hypothetical protein FUA48_13325 [Flavobacterium alkalisoli]